jgi:glycosyltransferase involved in cell wall biosynthesis
MIQLGLDSPIVVFTRSMEGGGAERVAVNLVNDFISRGYPVDLVLQYREGPYLGDLDERVNVVELNRRVRYGLRRLLRHLRRRQPRALLALQTEANVLGILAWGLSGLRGRVVVSEQNSLVGAGWTRRLAIGLTYGRADCAAACSDALGAELRRLGVPASNVKTIPNPVSDGVEAFAMPPLPDEDRRRPMIVGTGRLEPQKDFGTLIRAFAMLRRERCASLCILGEGSERSRLESLASDLGVDSDVHLPGFVKPPWEVMSKASAFVLSSRWEGWPNVLVEALALGVPVVATDCPTGPSEILDGGRYGRLVPVGDVEAMAEAISGTLASPFSASVLRARSREWTVERIADSYLDALGLSRRHVKSSRALDEAGSA